VTSFLRRYGGWILALALLNWLVWMAFELGHSRQLSEHDLWPLRMYLASGLFITGSVAGYMPGSFQAVYVYNATKGIHRLIVVCPAQ
jgi:hypothetical protein